jgi:hypothetical protein
LFATENRIKLIKAKFSMQGIPAKKTANQIGRQVSDHHGGRFIKEAEEDPS